VRHPAPVEIVGTYKFSVSGERAAPTSEPGSGTASADLGRLASELDLPLAALEQMERRYLEAQLEFVFLVELVVRTQGRPLDLSGFRQVDPCFPDSGWQVPHQSTRLSADGTRWLEDLPTALRLDPELLHEELRFAFFMHFLDPDRPLDTPFGPVALPPVTPLPVRLRSFHYEPFEPL
jgi:hypothetical protein